MTKKSSQSPEQQTTNRWMFLILVLAFLAPFGFVMAQGAEWHYLHLVAFLWDYRNWSNVHGDVVSGFTIMSPLLIIGTAIYSSIRLVFAYVVIENLQGMRSVRSVKSLGLLSQLPVSLFYLPYILNLSPNSSIGGPIPILLLAGLVVAHYKGKEPATEPWLEKQQNFR